VRVTALKSVDFPTFGSPTIPVLNIQPQMNTDSGMMFDIWPGIICVSSVIIRAQKSSRASGIDRLCRASRQRSISHAREPIDFIVQ
jgi:hypothetical protein